MDLVKLHDDALIYASDLLAMPDHIYAESESVFRGLIGRAGGGLLTNPEFASLDDGVVDVTAGFILCSKRSVNAEKTKAFRLVRYNPANQAQKNLGASKINVIVPQSVANGGCYIYARQVVEQANVQPENRIFWGGTFGVKEKVVLVHTRHIQTIEFLATISTNPLAHVSEEPWTRIAEVFLDSDGKVTAIVPNYVWDSTEGKSFLTGSRYNWLFDAPSNRVRPEAPLGDGVDTNGNGVDDNVDSFISDLKTANDVTKIDYATIGDVAGREELPTFGPVGMLVKLREQVLRLKDANAARGGSSAGKWSNGFFLASWLKWPSEWEGGDHAAGEDNTGISPNPTNGAIGLKQILAKLLEIEMKLFNYDAELIARISDLESRIVEVEKHSIVSHAFVNAWIPECGNGGTHGFTGSADPTFLQGAQTIGPGAGSGEVDQWGRGTYIAEWQHGGTGSSYAPEGYGPHGGKEDIGPTYLWRDWGSIIPNVGYRHRRNDAVVYATLWHRVVASPGMRFIRNGEYSNAFKEADNVPVRNHLTAPATEGSPFFLTAKSAYNPNFEFMVAGHGLPIIGTGNQKTAAFLGMAPLPTEGMNEANLISYFYRMASPADIESVIGLPTYNPPQDQQYWGMFADEHQGVHGGFNYQHNRWEGENGQGGATAPKNGSGSDISLGGTGIPVGDVTLIHLREWNMGCSHIVGQLRYGRTTFYEIDEIVEGAKYSPAFYEGWTDGEILPIDPYTKGFSIPNSVLNFNVLASNWSDVVEVEQDGTTPTRYGKTSSFSQVYRNNARRWGKANNKFVSQQADAGEDPLVTFSYPVSAVFATPVTRICNPGRTKSWPPPIGPHSPESPSGGGGSSDLFFSMTYEDHPRGGVYPGPKNHIVDRNHYYQLKGDNQPHKATYQEALPIPVEPGDDPETANNPAPVSPFLLYFKHRQSWEAGNRTFDYITGIAKDESAEIPTTNPFGPFGMTDKFTGETLTSLPDGCANVQTTADFDAVKVGGHAFNMEDGLPIAQHVAKQVSSNAPADDPTQGWNHGWFSDATVRCVEPDFPNNRVVGHSFFIISVGGAISAVGATAPSNTMQHHPLSAGTAGMMSSRAAMIEYIATYLVPYSIADKVCDPQALEVAEHFHPGLQKSVTTTGLTGYPQADDQIPHWKLGPDPGAANYGVGNYYAQPWYTSPSIKNSDWVDPGNGVSAVGAEHFPGVDRISDADTDWNYSKNLCGALRPSELQVWHDGNQGGEALPTAAPDSFTEVDGDG